jgi:hypothetical protein
MNMSMNMNMNIERIEIDIQIDRFLVEKTHASRLRRYNRNVSPPKRHLRAEAPRHLTHQEGRFFYGPNVTLVERFVDLLRHQRDAGAAAAAPGEHPSACRHDYT